MTDPRPDPDPAIQRLRDALTLEHNIHWSRAGALREVCSAAQALLDRLQAHTAPEPGTTTVQWAGMTWEVRQGKDKRFATLVVVEPPPAPSTPEPGVVRPNTQRKTDRLDVVAHLEEFASGPHYFPPPPPAPSTPEAESNGA